MPPSQETTLEATLPPQEQEHTHSQQQQPEQEQEGGLKEREGGEEKGEGEGEMKFVGKITSLPLVSSLQTYYSSQKEKYSLLSKMDSQIRGNLPPLPLSSQMMTHLDGYACQGLDSLERNVPLIKEPPQVILENSKKYVQNFYDPLNGYVQTIKDSKNYKYVQSLKDSGSEYVDQLLDKALLFSEERIETFLPEQKEVQDQEMKDLGEGEKEKEKEKEGEGERESKRQKVSHLARAQTLGSVLTQRLSSRAQKQLSLLRQSSLSLSPQEELLKIQKIISVDMVRSAGENVEKQFLVLRQKFSELRLPEDKKFPDLKFLDEKFSDLKAQFAQGLEKAEKMTPESVKETTRNVLLALSRNVGEFSENVGRTLGQMSQQVKSHQENHVNFKVVLDTLQGSLAFFSTFALSLAVAAPPKEKGEKGEEKEVKEEEEKKEN